MNRRVLALAAGAALLPAVVAASGFVGVAAASKVTIVVATESGPVGASVTENAKAFMKAYPNVKVQVDEYAQTPYEAQGPLLFRSSKRPDVAWFWNEAEWQTMANAGLFEPLNSLYQSQGWYKAFPKSTVQSVTGKDGKIYAVDQSVVWGPVVFYNKKAFAKAHIAVPTTFAQWLADGAKLRKAGYIPMVAGIQDVGILVLDGLIGNTFTPAHFQSLVNGKTPYTTPGMVSVFQSLQKMNKALLPSGAAATTDNNAEALFAQGKAAMYSEGSWGASTAALGSLLPKGFQMGSFFYPKMYPTVTPKVELYAGNLFMVLAGIGSTETQWSNKFVAFAMSKGQQEAMAAAKQLFPGRTDIPQAKIQELGPQYMSLYGLLKKTQTAPFWHIVVSNALSTGGAQITTGVVAGTSTPQQAAAQLQQLAK